MGLRELETGLDAVLASPGPEQLDYLSGHLTSDSLLGEDALPEGLASSLVHGRIGDQVDGIGAFLPGLDSPMSLDVAATIASDGRPMAKKRLSQAEPAALHVLLDMPDRLESLTGNYHAKNLGIFVAALCARVAEETESELNIYHNDGTSSGLLYEGTADDSYAAFNQLEGRIARRVAEASAPNLRSLILASNKRIDDEHDAVFVVSDFLDGYDEDSGSFEWERPLGQLAAQVGDRLWAARLVSPAQSSVPPGVFDGLSFDTIQSTNARHEEAARQKDLRIQAAVQNVRSISLDTFRGNNDMHPVRKITKFVLGSL